MTTLPEFLLARIAEDEADARAARSDLWAVEGMDRPIIEEGADVYPSVLTFAQRFTPARVLAECEAKRRIVKLHAELAYDEYEYSGWVNLALDTLRALALPYADHPDYQEAWRP